MKKFLIILFIGHVLNFQIYSEALASDVEADGILNRLSNLVPKATLNKSLEDGEKNISKILKDLESEVSSKEQGRVKELDEKAINDFLKPKTKLEILKDFFKNLLKFKNPFKKSQYQKDLSRLESEVKSQIDEISKSIESDFKSGNFNRIKQFENKIERIKKIIGEDFINQTGITKGIESQLKKLTSYSELGDRIGSKIEELGLTGFFERLPEYKDPETLGRIRELEKFLKDLPAKDGNIESVKEAINTTNLKILEYKNLSERPQGNRETEVTDFGELGDRIGNKITELGLTGFFESHHKDKDPKTLDKIRELEKFLKDLPAEARNMESVKEAINEINSKIRDYKNLPERPQGNRRTERTREGEFGRPEMRGEVY